MAGAPPAAAAAFLAVFSRADLQHRGETQPGQKKWIFLVEKRANVWLVAGDTLGQALQLAFIAVDLRTYCPWHAALGLDHGVVAHLLLDRGRKGHIIELHEAGEGSGLQSHHLCLPCRAACEARAGTECNGVERACRERSGRAWWMMRALRFD
jgi:hypothetical protein